MFDRILNSAVFFDSHKCLFSKLNPLKRHPHKMVKHTQIIRWLLPTNCLSVWPSSGFRA